MKVVARLVWIGLGGCQIIQRLAVLFAPALGEEWRVDAGQVTRGGRPWRVDAGFGDGDAWTPNRLGKVSVDILNDDFVLGGRINDTTT